MGRRNLLHRDENKEYVAETDESYPGTDQYKIPRLVFKNAVESIPNDVTFRLKFWDQCRLFSDTENLQRDVVESIRNDLCKENPEAWMAWALFQWEQKQKDIAVTAENEEGDEDRCESDGDAVADKVKQKEAADVNESEEDFEGPT